MAGQIPQSFIEDLRDRLPIVDVVSSRIKLKKAGSTYKACCPFHNENTPSFNVNAQKNFYHCFGCGASGDAISFLREHDNLSFVEAVEELAKIAGKEVLCSLEKISDTKIATDNINLIFFLRKLGFFWIKFRSFRIVVEIKNFSKY